MGAMLDAPWAGAIFAPPTPTDIATIEAAIVTQLRAQISSIEIAHYPAEPETWRLTHRVGAALVIYQVLRPLATRSGRSAPPDPGVPTV